MTAKMRAEADYVFYSRFALIIKKFILIIQELLKMSRESMKIEGFRRKFAEIRNKQHKPQGRGKSDAENTLEMLLGLKQNNTQTGDLGFAELKVRMKGKTSSVKLFSLDKDAWGIDKDDETQKFGNRKDESRKHLFLERRKGTITKTGLQFFSNDEAVAILSPVGDIIAQWSLDTLINVFTNKLKNLVIVNTETVLGPGGYDYFVYRTAVYLHGFSKTSIRAAFLNNVITLDTHIESINIKSDGSWRMKHRGTALRINEEHLEEIYEHRDFL